MKALGVRSVYVLDDQDPFEVPLAAIVAGDASRRAGIDVAGARQHPQHGAAASTTGEVEKVATSGAQAVFFAGRRQPATAALWRALHAADPQLLLLARARCSNSTVHLAIGAAGASTYLTTPVLALAATRPAARVLADYRHEFGGEAGPYALYGYEAMKAVLDAIAASGIHATDRREVISRVLKAPPRASVLGPLAIRPNGERTPAPYGVDTVKDGKAAFLRAVDLAHGEGPRQVLVIH